MGKGGSSPEPPDPEKTAAAASYWNTYDTYGPDGAGVRHGYTDASGQFVLPGGGATAGSSANNIPRGPASATRGSDRLRQANGQFVLPEDRTGTAGSSANNIPRVPAGATRGSDLPNPLREDRTGTGGFWNNIPRVLAGATRGSGGSDRLRQAKKYFESPTERAIREMLNPASVDFTERMIGDNVENLPDPGRVAGRGNVAQDIFDRNYSMMQPAIEQNNDRLISNLQARGLPVGGEAFNEAYGAQQRETQDTISRLAQDANVGAGQEQSRQLAMDQSVRQNAMSEISALMGGAYQAPSKLPNAGGPNIDYAGMANQQFRAQQANAQREQQQSQNTAKTIGQIGAALIKSAGDSKAMTGEVDPHWAGNVVQAMPIYEWSYLLGEGPEGDTATHIGPLAEDFHGLTGLSGPRAISVIDYLGLLLAALQGTVNRVEVLENALSNERVH